MNYYEKIASDPHVMLGKPVIKGTRITVESLLQKIAGGFSFEEIMEMHPHITKDDILAAVGYAAAVVGSEEILKNA